MMANITLIIVLGCSILVNVFTAAICASQKDKIKSLNATVERKQILLIKAANVLRPLVKSTADAANKEDHPH